MYNGYYICNCKCAIKTYLDGQSVMYVHVENSALHVMFIAGVSVQLAW